MTPILTDARCQACGRETIAPVSLDGALLDISCWLHETGHAPKPTGVEP